MTKANHNYEINENVRVILILFSRIILIQHNFLFFFKNRAPKMTFNLFEECEICLTH